MDICFIRGRAEIGTVFIKRATTKELNETIKSAYPENSEEIKNEISNRNLTLKITSNERRVKNWRKFKQKKRVIKSLKRCSKVSDFVEIARKRLQFQNVTDNRKYRKNFTKDKAENKKEILNNNINTISIVERTELKMLELILMKKVTLRRVLLTLESLYD